MSIGEYQCDIIDILQNGDFSVLQKLSSFCYNFEMYVASKIKSATTCESEYAQWKTTNIDKMSKLEEQAKALQFEIDDVKLQQEIVDKKITNVIKQEEKLKNKITEIKAYRNALALELVDLKQEVQERKEKKRKNWDAIKRATSVYKSNLNFVIHVDKKENFDIVKVSFFRNNESIRDKYYVELVKEDKLWKVMEIRPMLRKEHWIDLKGTVDFTKQSEISNVVAFLCLLRMIFLKHYMESS